MKEKLRGLRVLLVDDIPAMRLVVRQMLRSLGVQHIFEANDGSSALQRIRDEPIDVVLSDWNMIPMTGLDLLRALRDEPETTKIPFIMFTGENTADRIAQAHSAGVNGYLIKPFGKDTLAKQLHRIIAKPATSRTTRTLAH